MPTRDEIEASVDHNGKGATRKLLESWGVEWPPKKGWKKELLRNADAKRGIEKCSKKPKKAKLAKVKTKRQIARHFYQTAEWKRLRFAALTSHGQRCMCCGWSPGHGNNNHLVVDHIKSRRLRPDLELELSNLQVLCNECNLGKGSFSSADFRPTNYRNQENQ